MSKELYKQCKLTRPGPNGGEITYIAYIPAKFARKGRNILIEMGTVSNGCMVDTSNTYYVEWKVTETYSTKTTDQLDEQRKAQKRWNEVIK